MPAFCVSGITRPCDGTRGRRGRRRRERERQVPIVDWRIREPGKEVCLAAAGSLIPFLWAAQTGERLRALKYICVRESCRAVFGNSQLYCARLCRIRPRLF